MNNLVTKTNTDQLIQEAYRFGLGGHTRKAYQGNLKVFLHFLQSYQGEVADVYSSFREYLETITTNPLTGNEVEVGTKRNYMKAAKKFLLFAHRKGILPTDVTIGVPNFRDGKKHKKDGLSDDDVATIVEEMTAMDSSPENARLKAIMTLLCHQGLRQYEVVGLKRKHIDLNKGLAWVLGKGEDEREKIHLHPRTVEALEEYLNQYEVTNGNPLFFSISRAATDNTQPLTERGLRKTVTKFFRELGIESTVHGTRHWFTTRNIKAFKGDLTKVQKLTRHKSLATLEVYNDAVQTKADLDIYVQAFQDVRL